MGADLRGADLRGARLHDAKLDYAKYDPYTMFSKGFDPEEAGLVLVE